MREGCLYCGGIVSARQVCLWAGLVGLSPYDDRRWYWTTQYDAHCRRRWCRTLHAFWSGKVGRDRPNAPHTKTAWRGPAVYLYELAAFLGRMAEPTSERDREFSKRFSICSRRT